MPNLQRKRSFAAAPLHNCMLLLAPLVAQNVPLIAGRISKSKKET